MSTVAQRKPQRSKEDKFPFAHLPGLVQTQILRQYVPFSDKVTVLSNMPEFAGLLDRDSPCWVRGYGALFDLLPALSALTPGCYVRAHEDSSVPHHVYYVSMDRENHITLTLCMLLNPNWWYRKGEWKKGRRRNASRTERVDSTNDLRNFIHLFLNTYILTKHSHVRIYVKDKYVFVVDRLQRKVFWGDCRTFDLYQSGNCLVTLRSRERLDSVCIHVNISDDTVLYVHDNKKEVLRSASFESVVLCENTNKVRESRNVLEISFEILENNTIQTSIEKHQEFYFRYNANLWSNQWMTFFRSHNAINVYPFYY